jgi:hypothetical protein
MTGSMALEPYASHSEALVQAVQNGDTDTVRALIPTCKHRAFNSTLLGTAAGAGYLEIVRLLIPVCDPKANDSSALTLAATNGHRDVVRALIPVSDINVHKGKGCTALLWAAFNGHAEVVRELMTVSGPRLNDSKALLAAAQNADEHIVAELAPVSDVASVFRIELANAQLDARQVIDPLCIEHSLIAVDTLFPHVSEEERDRALAELPPAVVTRLPRLSAWHQARVLQTRLPPVALEGSGRRRRRRCL